MVHWLQGIPPFCRVRGRTTLRPAVSRDAMSDNLVIAGLPPAQGLYDPRHEHDACGIGFVANIKGRKSHDIIVKGIQVLINLTHRGACGCDPETGDGAGVLIQIPHEFFARECARLGFTLPAPGEYGVGMMFLPVEPHARLQCEGIVERIVREEGLTVLGWRDTPIDGTAIGRVARASQPYIEQIFVGRGRGMNEEQLERKLYVVRKRAETEIAASDIPGKELLLHALAFGAHHRLQGAAAGAADRQLLSRAERPGRGQRAVPGAPALLHQHVPHLATGAPVPLHRAQRRDQHPARQRELDARAAIGAGLAAVRRRHQEAVPHHPAGRQRFGELRQRAGAAGAWPGVAAARHGHADSGGLGQEPAHEPAEARLLRIPRLADGALGRPGGHRLHRRPRRSAPPWTATACARRATW